MPPILPLANVVRGHTYCAAFAAMHLLPRRMGHFHDGPVISVTNCYRQKPLGSIGYDSPRLGKGSVVNMDIYGLWIMDGNWMVMVGISDPEIYAIFSRRKQCRLRRSWNFDSSPPGRTAWIPSGEANNTIIVHFNHKKTEG